MSPFSHLSRSSRTRAFLICAAAFCMLSSPAAAATIELSGVLDGAQANAGAGTGSTATGVVNIMLDDVTNEMTWSASFSGLLSTYVAAHFHGPALPNQNTGIQVGVSFDTDVAQVNGTSNGTASLTGQQAADLVAGLWYLNVHTTLSMGGEIRANLTAVPEPSTALLLAGGLAFMARGRRSRR